MTEDQIMRMAAHMMDALNIPAERQGEVARRIALSGNLIEVRCNRRDIPPALEGILELLVTDVLEADGLVPGRGKDGAGPVASITRGDTSITYQDDAAVTAAASVYLKNYDYAIRRFKRMNLPLSKDEMQMMEYGA